MVTHTTDNIFHFHPVAIVHSCYREKFGIPRQAGLVASSRATIELLPPYNQRDMVKDLEGFSHIWVIFVFHQHIGRGYHPLVSPPRVAPHQRFGLFATRSPFRPNPVGLSVVRLDAIEQSTQQNRERLLLHIRGADLLDQTPVLDIKPYIPYADCIAHASGGFTDTIETTGFDIQFSEAARKQIAQAEQLIPDIALFIEELLSQDPRPKYDKAIKQQYRSKVYDYDLHWQVDQNQILVTALEKI